MASLGTPNLAAAGPITFELVNVRFQSGSAITGSFSFDPATFVISNANIATPGDIFAPADSFGSGFYLDATHYPLSFFPLSPLPGDAAFVFYGSLPGDSYGSFLYLDFSTSYLPISTGSIIDMDLNRRQASDWQSGPVNGYDPHGQFNGGEYLASGQLVPTSVPEPSTFALFWIALMGLGIKSFRRSKGPQPVG